MFQSLSDRLSGILDKLTRRGSLTDSDVAEAMREVRRALLEADVALEVVRDFTDKVKAKAVGQDVVKSVTPGQMVVKIVNDELVAMLGSDAEPIDLVAQPPVAILLVGLQGSGKTTTCAKIGYRLTNRDKKKVLMASLDMRRPAAQEQLGFWASRPRSTRCRSFPARCRSRSRPRAIEAARLGGYDVVLLDTAGRTHIDDELMREAAEVRDIAHPHETLLVADALTGQDAVKLAKSFNERGRHHRHRADPRRRRRPRRCRALHARGDRQAHQADRRRREVGRAGGLPPRPHRRPHPRHGRRGEPGREGRADHRHGEGAGHRRRRCARASSTWRTSPISSSRWRSSAACRA